MGPSPRARGSRVGESDRRELVGSIPASAGKPGTTASIPPRARVHPRERGEAGRCVAGYGVWQGPSPRARGSQYEVAADAEISGSIPASAGKPTPSPSAR